MKLDESQGFMSEGTVIDTKQFDIGNKQIIFSILRSKMYPNPIKAFTQEIMSNARDANREVGKNDVPIEVKLPNRFDPCFHVRDFGPGISPERMENIFIKYGNSTKRDTNDQTGGFGLGAKSPWAYTDSFCITTYIPDENDNMIERSYVAVIGPDKIGELKFISEEFVKDELQGTKITVACKPGDESRFIEWVRVATKYWDNKYVKDSVKPIFFNNDIIYPEESILFEGNRWFCKDKDIYSYSKSDPMAIIDGIPYKLNWSNLNLSDYDKTTKDVFDRLSYYPVCMFFDTGELPLAANREEIEYIPEAVKTIHTRFGELLEELMKIVNESVKNAKNLYEANLMFNKIRNNFTGILGSAEWKGINITGKGPNLTNTGIHIIHYSRNYRTNDQFRKNSHYYHNTFSIEDGNLVIFNDEDNRNPNRRRLKTIFTNEKIQSVSVLQFPEDDQKRKESKKKLEDIKIDLWEIGNISDYEKTAVVRNSSGSSNNTKANGYTVPRIWQFTGNTNNSKDSWSADYIDDQQDLIENGEGIYILLHRREPSMVSTGKNINIYDLVKIYELFGDKKIYGISKKAIDKVSKNWIKLEDAVLAKIKELEKDPEIIDFVNAKNTEMLCQFKFYNLFHSFKSEYQNLTDGKLKEYFEWSKKYDNSQVKMNNIRNLIAFYKFHVDSKYQNKILNNKNSQYDFYKIYLDVKTTYPMIGEGLIDFSGRSSKVPAIKKDFLGYVKMCESRPDDSEWEDDDEKEEKVA